MKRKKIDLRNWERREHFEFFNHMDIPFFSVTNDVDVTSLVDYTNKNNISFFKTMLFIISKVSNEYNPLKLRIEDEKVYLYESVKPSFTYFLKDRLYSNITIEYINDLKTFISSIDDFVEKNKNKVILKDSSDVNSCLFITSLPWIKYKEMSHPMNLKPSDSIPRICWGKYEKDFKDRFMMPVSIQVHHSLMDGYHISEFYKKIQNILDNIERDI